MNVNSVIARARAILLTPSAEWPKIAERPETIQGLYRGYLLLLAAVPAACGILHLAILRLSTPRAEHVGLISGLIDTVLRYAVSLAAVLILALVVNLLAPLFSTEKNLTQAFKTVAYSFTAFFLSGAAIIIPSMNLAVLIMLAGMAFGFYLLFLGLPIVMKAPKNKAALYTLAVFASAFILFVMLGWILGQSAPVAQKTAEAGVIAAQIVAPKPAAAATDPRNAQDVESLAPEKIQSFVPDVLGGLKRGTISVERDESLGFEMSDARATYSDGAKSVLALQITDMGSPRALSAVASWARADQDRQTETGIEKTYKSGGRLFHETWDTGTKTGTYSVILVNRFLVRIAGQAESIDLLKAPMAGIDLAGLEGLKDEGVKRAQ